MKLAETKYDNSETGCCARLDVAKWDERELEWTDKPFLKDHVRALLHIPINMGTVMGRDQKAIEDAAAYPEDPFCLSDEVSPWGSDVRGQATSVLLCDLPEMREEIGRESCRPVRAGGVADSAGLRVGARLRRHAHAGAVGEFFGRVGDDDVSGGEPAAHFRSVR